MTELSALIFDWDGTLMDSVSKIVGAMQAAADQLRLEVRSAREVRDIIGLGLPEAIATLYPELQDPAVSVSLAQAYSNQYIQLEEAPSPLFDGVAESLAFFREAGVPLAVATGKSRRGLDRVLAQHDLVGFFDATRCADETASKPDPLMLLQIAEQLGVAPSRALLLGDSEFDLRMAANAGMRAAAVSFGAQPREHLMRFAPERCFDDFHDFRGWVSPQLRTCRTAEV